jgi:hypothetical protein
MSWTRRIYRKFRSSDGRIKLGTLLGVSAAVAALALLVGVLPATAEDGTSKGVTPAKVDLGGQPNDCAAVDSAASYELRIQNPQNGKSYPLQDITGASVTLTINDTDDELEYAIDQLPGATLDVGAFDVVVKGGKKSHHYDNDGQVGPLTADDGLTAPPKGQGFFDISHVSLCYDEFALVELGTKYHDRDTDSNFDPTEEEGLGGFTITAFSGTDPGTSSTTSSQVGSEGSYSLALAPGPYTVCEATGATTDLPPSDPDSGFTWIWAQSGPDNDLCASLEGYEPGGYAVVVADDGGVTVDDVPLDAEPNKPADFGNHLQVAIDCSAGNVVVILGGPGTDDNPHVTITIPQDAPSCSGGNVWTTTFDVGRSDPDGGDSDFWTQFYVFGGLPTDDAVVVDIVSVWDAEEADYVVQDLDGDTCDSGDLCTTVLQVPTTLVQLDPGGIFQPVVLCNTLTDGLPNVVPDDMPYCLDSRTIAEGGGLPNGYVQLTENYLLLGDPRSFR